MNDLRLLRELLDPTATVGEALRLAPQRRRFLRGRRKGSVSSRRAARREPLRTGGSASSTGAPAVSMTPCGPACGASCRAACPSACPSASPACAAR